MRHVRIGEASRDGIEQVLVRGQRSRRSGATFEGRPYKVSRFWVNPRRVVAVSVAQRAVATDTVASIQFLARRRVPRKIAYVRFLRPHRGGYRHRQDQAA